MKVNRYILENFTEAILLLGFADASVAAYDDAIFGHSANSSNPSSMNHVASKSWIASLKIISVSWQELCTRLLLRKHLSKGHPSLKFDIPGAISLLDSILTLAWIKTPAHGLKWSLSGDKIRPAITQLTFYPLEQILKNR